MLTRSVPVADRLSGEVAGRTPSRIEHPQLQGSSRQILFRIVQDR